MIIDAEGLFNGNRWRKCSVSARLNAPYLMLVANGYGRLEIDPLRILARAYATFSTRPAEQELLGWIQEYAGAHLLFLYEVDGQIWGQWDTPERLLAKYRTAADKRSPAPPEPAFTDWITAYRTGNTAAQFTKASRNVSEKLLEHSPCGVGIGAGDGIGGGENICAAQSAARVSSESSSSSGRAKNGPSQEEEERFETFWSQYWLKKGRLPAFRVFLKQVRSPERFEAVMSGLMQQLPEMLGRKPEHRPHATTWLNGERWNDEAAPVHQDAFSELLNHAKENQE